MNGKYRHFLKTRSAGFTLTELMITVVIISILTSIALPSYQNYMRKARRGSAESFLMDLAQRQQQYLLDNRAYASAATSLGYASTPGDVSPYYTVAISLTAGPPATFSIAATPTSLQSADSCGTLTITSAGTKSSSAGSNCW